MIALKIRFQHMDFEEHSNIQSIAADLSLSSLLFNVMVIIETTIQFLMCCSYFLHLSIARETTLQCT